MRTGALLLGMLMTALALAQERPEDDERYFPQQITAKELLYACASSSLTTLAKRVRMSVPVSGSNALSVICDTSGTCFTKTI